MQQCRPQRREQLLQQSAGRWLYVGHLCDRGAGAKPVSTAFTAATLTAAAFTAATLTAAFTSTAWAATTYAATLTVAA